MSEKLEKKVDMTTDTVEKLCLASKARAIKHFCFVGNWTPEEAGGAVDHNVETSAPEALQFLSGRTTWEWLHL